MGYFGDKPFILQIHHEGEWWVSDWFDTPESARTAAQKKATPWRVIRYATGAVVSCGNPVWVHAITVPGELHIIDWTQWLHTASLMLLQAQVALLEAVIASYAVIWEEVSSHLREQVEARMQLYESQCCDVNIEIQKRLQSQYVALCEN